MAEPEFSEPAIEAREEQHLAVVRETVAFDRIPDLYDRAYPLIFGALELQGLSAAAPPMGVMHGEPGDALDLSVAVPVVEPFAEAGEVGAETIPAGRFATLLVRGDYSRLAAAYEHVFDWVAEQGLTQAGLAWEQYLTEPEPGGDPALNETLIGVQVVS